MTAGTRTGRRAAGLVAAVAVVLALLPPAAGARPPGASPDPALSPARADTPDHVPGEVIVKMRAGARAAAVLERAGARRARSLVAPRLFAARTPAGVTVAAALRQLRADPAVAYAEPNYLYRATTIPNDPRFTDQWALHNTGQVVNGVGGTAGADVSAPKAWTATTGSHDIVVAVVDTGVEGNHPDLAPNMWRNPNETLDGTDGDGNGFVDDVAGWDFVDRNNDPRDLEGHGTHVAGTIAAAGDNGIGIAGVTWRARIMPLRVLDANGVGTAANIAAAFNYAVANGAHVINASFGGPGSSLAVREAIVSAPETLFVTAAGNDGANNDNSQSFPCNHRGPNLICATATDQNDRLPFFASYGATTVHLGAPGVRILSTQPALRTALSDGFETPLDGRWVSGGVNNTWGRGVDALGHYLAASPGGPYLPNTHSWIRTAAAADLRGLTACRLGYVMRLDTEPGVDRVFVEASSDASAWDEIVSWSGSTSNRWVRRSHDLGSFNGRLMYLRFRFVSNATVQGAGFDADDVRVRCLAPTPSGTDLSFATGTSMATPHVTGAAALLFALRPGASATEVGNAILAGVDPLSSLAGRTVTGGRLNVAGAMAALVPGIAFGDSEQPTPDPSPSEPDEDMVEVVRHDRAVGLRLRANLVARGRVRAPGAPAGCRAFVPVVVRRNGRVVARTETLLDGSYRVRVRPRRGWYRVVARRVVTGGGTDVCKIARSPLRFRR